MKTFKEWLDGREPALDQDLPKFLTAEEIFGSVSLEDHEDLTGRFNFAGGDDGKLLDFKYKLAKERGLVDDILKNGTRSPLEIHVDDEGNRTLTGGHHRLAIALKHFPKKPMPVTYWTG